MIRLLLCSMRVDVDVSEIRFWKKRDEEEEEEKGEEEEGEGEEEEGEKENQPFLGRPIVCLSLLKGEKKKAREKRYFNQCLCQE